jgi:hypothetical protein
VEGTGGSRVLAPSRSSARPTPVADDLRCLVTISRRHDGAVRIRQVIARIDDGAPATLMHGDAVTVEVPPGRHLLRANNTLVWKRVAFNVEPGEHLEFVLINRAGRFTMGFLVIMGVAPLLLRIETRALA